MIVVNELGRVVKSTSLVQEDVLQLDAPMRVNPTGVADTNVLAYNAASSTWLPSAAGSGTVGGSGTAPKIPKWTAGTALGDSILSETTSGATITLTQGVVTSGSPNALVVVGGAHTTLAASVEAIDVNVNLARTVEFSTGALTTQRAVVFQAPTYAFVGASTITTAATVAITGAPAVGSNATITTPLAVWVQAGNVLFGAAPLSTSFVAALEISTAIVTDSTHTNAYALLFTSTITADANGRNIRGALIYPSIAKSTFTGLNAIGLEVGQNAISGSGTIDTWSTIRLDEKTIATANVGICFGTHPGGSVNYSIYNNSANNVYLGTGRVGIGAVPATAGFQLEITPASGFANVRLAGATGVNLRLEKASSTDSNTVRFFTGAAANFMIGTGIYTANNTQLDIGTGSAALVSIFSTGGVNVGAPTGGDKGSGTINTAADIYKNNSAYGNPAYALEQWATGSIVKYADREGALDYRRPTLEESENYIREKFELPGHRDDFGAFSGGEWVLEKLEELYTYTIELHNSVKILEENFR